MLSGWPRPLALQTLDIDVHCRQWALMVQGFKGAAKEDKADTRAACVQSAKDNLAINDASLCILSACHRLSQKADTGIMIRFCGHVSISPDMLPMWCLIKKDLQKCKDPPPEEKKCFIRFHQQWPYMDLAVGNNRFVRLDIIIGKSVLGANPMFSIQEPDVCFIIAFMTQSTPFS